MANTTRRKLATAAAGLAAAGAIGTGIALTTTAAAPDVNTHTNRITTGEVRGIPKGIELEWDNGKYVPIKVPGYESKADYPDEFWIYPRDYEKVKNKFKDK